MDDRPTMTADRLLSVMIGWRAAWQSTVGRRPSADELLIWATMCARDLSEDAATRWLQDDIEERRALMAD